jgi:hypothetical protein
MIEPTQTQIPQDASASAVFARLVQGDAIDIKSLTATQQLQLLYTVARKCAAGLAFLRFENGFKDHKALIAARAGRYSGGEVVFRRGAFGNSSFAPCALYPTHLFMGVGSNAKSAKADKMSMVSFALDLVDCGAVYLEDVSLSVVSSPYRKTTITKVTQIPVADLIHHLKYADIKHTDPKLLELIKAIMDIGLIPSTLDCLMLKLSELHSENVTRVKNLEAVKLGMYKLLPKFGIWVP